MKKAKNVILFIGDGMGYPSQTAGRILAGGEEYDTAIDKMPWSGSVKTYNIGKIFGLERSSDSDGQKDRTNSKLRSSNSGLSRNRNSIFMWCQGEFLHGWSKW